MQFLDILHQIEETIEDFKRHIHVAQIGDEVEPLLTLALKTNCTNKEFNMATLHSCYTNRNNFNCKYTMIAHEEKIIETYVTPIFNNISLSASQLLGKEGPKSIGPIICKKQECKLNIFAPNCSEAIMEDNFQNILKMCPFTVVDDIYNIIETQYGILISNNNCKVKTIQDNSVMELKIDTPVIVNAKGVIKITCPNLKTTITGDNDVIIKHSFSAEQLNNITNLSVIKTNEKLNTITMLNEYLDQGDAIVLSVGALITILLSIAALVEKISERYKCIKSNSERDIELPRILPKQF